LPLDHWEIQEFFENTNTFPAMSDRQIKHFLEFCQIMVNIRSFDRLEVQKLRQEANELEMKIEKAEKLQNAFQYHVSNYEKFNLTL